MLTVDNLTCVRGDRPLFSAASFALSSGEALYITGGNGVGKTSLLRLLCGLAMPEQGKVLWNGESVHRQREEFTRHLLYLGHAAAIKDELTACENLLVAARISGRQVIQGEVIDALRRFGLKGREHLPARVLSAGQRRRVNLARLLLPDPPTLWVLDEPFSALDVRAVEQLRQIIETHCQRGGMVIYTTHQEVAFVDVVVKRIAIERGVVGAC